MAKFTDLPYGLKLQILGHLITPTQPVHLIQWRLWALTPDIMFADEDADVETSLFSLLRSELEDIFFQVSLGDARRMWIQRVQWLVTSSSISDWEALIDKSNLSIVQYAPLIKQLETYFGAEVAHVVVVIDEWSFPRDERGQPLPPRERWAKRMTEQVSAVMDTCTKLKSLHVKLQAEMMPSHSDLSVPSQFDDFYRSDVFQAVWEVLASRYARTQAPLSSFDELYTTWRKRCQQRGIELTFTAKLVPPDTYSVHETPVHEEDLTHFWDVPRCIKIGDFKPWSGRCWAGLDWAIQRNQGRRRGEPVPMKRKHEAAMGPDCEC